MHTDPQPLAPLPQRNGAGLPAARTVNVQEAKTHLSALLTRVESGERIVLARHGKPIAQLIPLDPTPRRRLGFLKGRVDAAFFEPLPDDELRLWGA